MELPLYTDDLVASRKDEKHLGIIERTHADVDTHEPYPDRDEEQPIKRHASVKQADFAKFKREGIPPKNHVMLRWFHNDRAELLPHSAVRLVDRSLIIGDVVKRDDKDAMSGVVINASTACNLEGLCDLKPPRVADNTTLRGFRTISPTPDVPVWTPAVTQMPTLLDIPASELQYSQHLTEAEVVIYKSWIGRIEALTDKLTVRLSDNCVVELLDHRAEPIDDTVDRCSVGDVVVSKKGHLRTGRWLFGQYNPNTPPMGTVVEVRPVSAEVTWLQRRIGSKDEREPSRLLERSELESPFFRIYDKTRKPLGASRKLSRSVGTGDSPAVSNSEIDASLGLRVCFKDLAGACVKYDGSDPHGKLNRIDRRDTLGYDMNVYAIQSFHTNVSVQWQDLSISEHSSTELVPDSSIDDEHAIWPGEIAHSLTNKLAIDPWLREPSKVGVIQSVEAAERMAQIRWCPSASVLFAKGSTDAPEGLLSSVIGRASGDTEKVSLYDVEAPAAVNVRRGDFVLLTDPAADGSAVSNGDTSGLDEVTWFGEIVDTCLDGSLTVRLGAADRVRNVQLLREQVVVAVRSDGTEAGDDGFGNEGMVGPDSLVSDFMDEDEDTDVEDEEDEMDSELEARYEDENGDPMDEDDVENEEWESADEEQEMENRDPLHSIEDQMIENAMLLDTPNTATDPRNPLDATLRADPQAHNDPLQPTSNHSNTLSRGDTLMGNDPVSTFATNGDPHSTTHPKETEKAFSTYLDAPEPYMILDGAGTIDHRYAYTKPSWSPAHTKRTQKEHKILRSSNALPEGVYVRTWENRLDLLRVLIVGPVATPYEYAPFVIDLYLSPEFPSVPPDVVFQSWTAVGGLGGTGRVNPNLYEDGKICLSLLGTWEGDRGEGWNAGQSTVLQVLVSLLGLVLVREPYFNEAGYEHLAGLESSRLPSALYNERTYLRARAFILHALRSSTPQGVSPAGTEGVVDVISWLYIAKGGPQLLAKAVNALASILDRSEGVADVQRDGLNAVTKGACVPLRRMLAALRALDQARGSPAS